VFKPIFLNFKAFDRNKHPEVFVGVAFCGWGC
jgi:hypothetical protein